MTNRCAYSAQLLSVSSSPEDHEGLREVALRAGWLIDCASTVAEARARLAEHGAGLIFCSAVLPDGTWRDLLNQIAASAEPPKLIVTSRQADDYLWAEVLNLGGTDVLNKPFREPEVRQVLNTAFLRSSAA